jgi:hypothetical protein
MKELAIQLGIIHIHRELPTNIYSTDQSAKIFLLKTEYTPKAVARFVIILNFHYDWMEKDGLKVTSPEHKQDVEVNSHRVTSHYALNSK